MRTFSSSHGVAELLYPVGSALGALERGLMHEVLGLLTFVRLAEKNNFARVAERRLAREASGHGRADLDTSGWMPSIGSVTLMGHF